MPTIAFTEEEIDYIVDAIETAFNEGGYTDEEYEAATAILEKLSPGYVHLLWK